MFVVYIPYNKLQPFSLYYLIKHVFHHCLMLLHIINVYDGVSNLSITTKINKSQRTDKDHYDKIKSIP